MRTPQNPFDHPPDPAVFGEAQLPMRVRSFADGAVWWVDSFQIFRRDWLAWILANLLCVFLCFMAGLFPLIGVVLSYMLQTIMIGGLMIGCQKVEAGSRFRVSDLFAAFRGPDAGRLVWVSVLLMAGFAAFFLFIGIAFGLVNLSFSISRVYTLTNGENLPELLMFLLIMTVALSVLAMFYWFAPALIVLHGIGPVDAMRLSFMASLRNIASMLAFGIIGLLLLLLSFVPLFVGLLVFAPIAIIAIYVSTRSVFGSTPLALPVR